MDLLLVCVVCHQFSALLRLSFAFGVIVLSAEGVCAWTHGFDHRLGNFVNELRYRTYFEMSG